jgi:hypothetical protein
MILGVVGASFGSSARCVAWTGWMPSDLARLQARHWFLVVLTARHRGVGGKRPGTGGVLHRRRDDGIVDRALHGALPGRGSWGPSSLAIGLLFGKLAAFLGLGWLAFASGSVRPDPLGFAFGVTCCPVAVVWEAARAGRF